MENYLVSARKYRPSTFASVVGQKALTATLRNAIASGRLAHSYLFCGSRGVGKTSCARIFAKTINCEHLTPEGEACNECASCREFNSGMSMNIVELDAASNNGIDDMRGLIDQVQMPPSNGRYRVFIIDEVHMLSTAAFNAFLKTLEEPPSYVVFILATTEKHKIIPTILSRCQIYDFHRITIDDMIDHLAYVAQCEGINAERSALNVIASKADGAMRDALSIFDQVAASTRGDITYAATLDNLNVLDYAYYNRLLDAFLAGKVLDTWLIYKEIRDKGFDSQFFINGLAGYFRDLLVARDPATISLLDSSEEIKQQLATQGAKCTPDFLLKAIDLCNTADLKYREASNKQILIEITLAKVCQLLSPSPNNSDGHGEGQLKPIVPTEPTAVAAQPTAAAASQPTQAAPPPTPQAAPAPQPAPRRPIVAATPPRTAAHQSSGEQRHQRVSIRSQAQPEKVEQEQKSQNRTTPFTLETLDSAWDTYIASHPTAKIVINTMRMARPTNLQGAKFEIYVENDFQYETMVAQGTNICRYLADILANDMVTYSVKINTGAPPRHTLSERELLGCMIEENPKFKEFISKFKLKLS